jgi:putative membrane protein
MRRWISIYLKGFFMGTADMVPGVSGGTIALITGIYERLVTAISNADPRFVRTLLRSLSAPTNPDVRVDLVAELRRVDVGFLLALGAGVGTAIVAVSQVVEPLIETYPGLMAAFFFGLIGASAVVLARQVRLDARRALPIGAVGVALAASVAASATGDAPHMLPVVFLSGVIAVSAMILPGVSGAFFLYVLGQYEYMLTTLESFLDGLAGLPPGGGVAALVEPGIVVVTFLCGAVVGLLSLAHAVKWALERYRAETLVFLVALMIGGLALPAREIVVNVEPTPGSAVTAALVTVVGAGAVLALDLFTDDLDYTENGDTRGVTEERSPPVDAASDGGSDP